MGPGPASIALGVVILSYLFQRWVSKRNANLRKKIIPVSDLRVQRTAEMINSIQLIKLYAWETPRSEQIEALRKEEVKWLKSSGKEFDLFLSSS
jgi:ATP-binding cassette subfamily C (CFTR/MRP) protein 5